MSQYLAALTTAVPTFATLAYDALDIESGNEAPVPALLPATEDESLAAYGIPGDLSNPAHVALLWWTALLNHAEEVRLLSLHPTAWGDYEQARSVLDGKALASRVLRVVDAPRQGGCHAVHPRNARTSPSIRLVRHDRDLPDTRSHRGRDLARLGT